MSGEKGVLKYNLLLLLLSMIWGSTFVAQQIGMAKGIGPMTFNALRFPLGVLFLIPVILWRRRYITSVPESGPFPLAGSLLAGFFLFAAAILQQIGLQYTSSANAGFITGLYIIFVPIIGLLFGQRPARSLWVGVMVCVAGLYLLSFTSTFTMSRGDFLILICAVLWACQIIAIGRVAGKGDPIQIACLQFVVCSVLSAISALLFEDCSFEAVKAGAGAVAYAGFMSVGIAFTLQVICQKHCLPAPAAVIMSTEAVFAAIAGYVVLNQVLTLRALIGCGLILGGMLIVQLVPMWKTADHRLQTVRRERIRLWRKDGRG